VSAVSYYDCNIDEGYEQEHSFLQAEYCPWCKIAELEDELSQTQRSAGLMLTRMSKEDAEWCRQALAANKEKDNG